MDLDPCLMPADQRPNSESVAQIMRAWSRSLPRSFQPGEGDHCTEGLPERAFAQPQAAACDEQRRGWAIWLAAIPRPLIGAQCRDGRRMHRDLALLAPLPDRGYHTGIKVNIGIVERERLPRRMPLAASSPIIVWTVAPRTGGESVPAALINSSISAGE